MTIATVNGHVSTDLSKETDGCQEKAISDESDTHGKLGPDTNVDDIFHSIGVYGKYQIKQIMLLMLFMLENAFHLMGAVYIGFRPDYQCQEINTTKYLDHHHPSLQNVSDIYVNYMKCGMEIHVNASGRPLEFKEECLLGYQYSIPEDWSTVTQWNLVCDNAEKSEFAKTMIMFGQAAGAAIFSPLADRFGRKPCNIASRVLYFINAVVTVFCPGIEVFWLMRFLQGTFQGGCVMTVTTLIIEILPTDYRHRGEGFAMFAWSLGILFTTMIGYLCRFLPWRTMQLILALLTVHTAFDWLFLDESLRWLLANGKTDQAEKVIKKATKTNNKDYDTVIKAAIKSAKLEEKKREQAATKDVKKYSVLTILKHKSLLTRSIVLWFAWITNTLTYYGLMLTTSKLSGDRYLNSSLGALAEFPGIIVQQLFINRIGRKKMLMVFHGTAGISMVVALLTTSYGGDSTWLPYLGTAFSLIGRGAITGSFSSVFLFTPELYPTNLRNAGLGIASTISRAGSMVSPFAMTLSDYILWGPPAVFAALNVIVTISLLYLPETMGRELPTTVEEMKAWNDHKRTCCGSSPKEGDFKLEGQTNPAFTKL